MLDTKNDIVYRSWLTFGTRCCSIRTMRTRPETRHLSLLREFDKYRFRKKVRYALLHSDRVPENELPKGNPVKAKGQKDKTPRRYGSRKIKGSVAGAAKRLGILPRQLWRYIHEDPSLLDGVDHQPNLSIAARTDPKARKLLKAMAKKRKDDKKRDAKRRLALRKLSAQRRLAAKKKLKAKKLAARKKRAAKRLVALEKAKAKKLAAKTKRAAKKLAAKAKRAAKKKLKARAKKSSVKKRLVASRAGAASKKTKKKTSKVKAAPKKTKKKTSKPKARKPKLVPVTVIQVTSPSEPIEPAVEAEPVAPSEPAVSAEST